VRIFAGLAGLLLLRPAAESFGPRPGGSLIRLLYAGKHSFKFCDMAWREPAPALPCFFCLGESVSHCCQIHLASICQLTPWSGPTATSFAIPGLRRSTNHFPGVCAGGPIVIGEFLTSPPTATPPGAVTV